LHRYIFGLPLWQKNAVALSKEIMALAEKNLAPGAVIGYELGNEVWRQPYVVCTASACNAMQQQQTLGLGFVTTCT
jgi:hypothetical protein